MWLVRKHYARLRKKCFSGLVAAAKNGSDGGGPYKYVRRKMAGPAYRCRVVLPSLVVSEMKDRDVYADQDEAQAWARRMPGAITRLPCVRRTTGVSGLLGGALPSLHPRQSARPHIPSYPSLSVRRLRCCRSACCPYGQDLPLRCFSHCRIVLSGWAWRPACLTLDCRFAQDCAGPASAPGQPRRPRGRESSSQDWRRSDADPRSASSPYWVTNARSIT